MKSEVNFPSTDISFSKRVAEFWDWFPQVSDEYRRAIDNHAFDPHVQEFSKRMTHWFPKLAWVFGPGEEDGHSLTLSGDGVKLKQMLAAYWLSQAQTLEGWTFFASRQPSPVSRLTGLNFKFGNDEAIQPSELLFRTEVNEQNQRLDVQAWHPHFSSLDENDRFTILFILLDEALGEFGTEALIGEIDIAEFPVDDKTRTLLDLPAFVDQVADYYEWNTLSPLETYSIYELPEPSDAPRGDTVVGRTCIPEVIRDYFNQAEANDLVEVEDSGASVVYLAIDGQVIAQEQASEIRANIEDSLDDALMDGGVGRVLGGAFGTQYSYIDLLLFDPIEAEQVISRTLAGLQLSEHCKLFRFPNSIQQ